MPAISRRLFPSCQWLHLSLTTDHHLPGLAPSLGAGNRTAASHPFHFRIVEGRQRSLALTLAGGLGYIEQPLHSVPSIAAVRERFNCSLQAGVLLGIADQILGEVRAP